MLDSLLVTKFYILPVRAGLVRRPGLIERLNAGLDRKLTLVSAPAGFGKTTLIGDWVEGLQKTRKFNDHPIKVAWLSLDEEDNDPLRFLACIITAIYQIEGEQNIGQVELSMLQSPQPAPYTSILISLINDLTTIQDKIALVIDDYHLIESEPIHQAVQFLLNNLPPQLHLVILTRQDPHLPLGRLRARDQLTELRASDLRFNHAEAAEFLKHVMRLELSEADIVRLESHTEGWIAGLQLAALSIQRRSDVSSRVKAFSGSNRLVLDYLLKEVLEGQPEHVEQFLLQTSILDRLRGPLCEVITGQTDGQATLEMLEDNNLFIVPLDDERRWYRYHHLFADLLRHRLRQTRPDQLPILQHQASKWCEQNGFIDEAIDYALRAEEFERTAGLIDEFVEVIWHHTDHTRFRRWLDRLPDEAIISRPNLCILHAVHLFQSGHVDESEQRLKSVEQILEEGNASGTISLPESDLMILRGRAAVTRAGLASYRGDVPGIVRHARQALECLPESDTTWRSLAYDNLENAYSFMGEVDSAYQARI